MLFPIMFSRVMSDRSNAVIRHIWAQWERIIKGVLGRPDFSSLPDDILRKIRLMSLQYKYPYTSQAPRRRTLIGFETPTPEIQERIRRSGFYGIDGSWDTYINLKKTRLGDENYLPIRTGWLCLTGSSAGSIGCGLWWV